MINYRPRSTGRCPHCQTVVQFQEVKQPPSRGENSQPQSLSRLSLTTYSEPLHLTISSCPACRKLIISVRPEVRPAIPGQAPAPEHLVWPLSGSRPPVPKEVPDHIAADYREAGLVLTLSPKASAALSRRCLQAVLRDAGKAHQHNLSQQIEAVIPHLPSYLAQDIDAIRNIGNFAAHPAKDSATGEIIEVEPGEAEWNLDVLDGLFDFYYVQPALAQQKRDALNAKLSAAKKPPMK